MMIPFTKMHGIGNDYIYVNGYETVIADPVTVAKKISDRHFGVGGDGLILVLPPEKGVDAHVRMRMFNADGSESEMCGNGIRCVCKLAHDRGISKANPMRIQTGRGVLTLEYTIGGDGRVDQVTVNMGEPLWHPDVVGVRVEMIEDVLDQVEQLTGDALWTSRPAITFGGAGSMMFEAEAGVVKPGIARPSFKFLSMGNPHFVFFVREVRAIPLASVGPVVETHEAFPNRMNVHFVQVHSPREVTMRTWERGTGITLACGTGASAVCCAGGALDLTDREVLAHLPGGDLQLRWDEKSNHVFMAGPATEVFTGVWQDKG